MKLLCGEWYDYTQEFIGDYAKVGIDEEKPSGDCITLYNVIDSKGKLISDTWHRRVLLTRDMVSFDNETRFLFSIDDMLDK